MAETRTTADLMHTALVMVASTATLREAAVTLAENEVGVGLVRGSGALAGIVSERDVLLALADGSDPDDTRVEEIMNVDLARIVDTATFEEAVAEMARGGVRHLVVCRGDDAVGIISARDIISHLAATMTGGTT